MGKKPDSRAAGLDVGLSFIKWLTGAENLHYGFWEGLDVTAANLLAAQEAYTDKLFALMPEGRLDILDIGGGAGETARKLLARGHSVEIVVPSAFLAGRCRENAPDAEVHECRFEELETDRRFDLCLFSESFQYIPMEVALQKSAGLLKPGGRVIIADCFRTPAYRAADPQATVGGGHTLSRFRRVLARSPLEVVHEEDITRAVAPSVELEQGFFNIIGHGIRRVDTELSGTRPVLRWLIHRLLKMVLRERTRRRLDQRLNQKTRNIENFERYNRYLLMKLRPVAPTAD